MKNILSVLCALILLCLAGCGKTEAVKAAELAIEGIGSVSIESGEAIEHAQKLYDILTDDEKAMVDNRILLAEAVESYEQILAEQARNTLEAAYDELSKAYDIADRFGSDLYEAWRVGIQDKEQFKGANLNGSLKFLASNLFLSYDDLLEGACCAYSDMWGGDWNEKPDEDKQKIRDTIATGTLFYFSQNNIYVSCVNCVRFGYELNGSTAEADECIMKAGTAIASIDKSLVDERLLDSFEELKSSLLSLLEFCMEPTGSFNQCGETINDYRNTIRSCMSSIEGAM